VNSAGILQNLADLLTRLPDESVEGLLFAFQSVVDGLDETGRESAVQLLQGAAGACAEDWRRERLAQAAEALANGGVAGAAANMPEAARGVTQEEWDEKWAPTFLPPPEADPEEEDEEEREEYEAEDLEVEEEDDVEDEAEEVEEDEEAEDEGDEEDED
jgi:hypothetical protein